MHNDLNRIDACKDVAIQADLLATKTKIEWEIAAGNDINDCVVNKLE